MNNTQEELKVSVSITTYNHEKYIRQCLESVIIQECNFDFEIIVGEDCSTDKTKKIIEEFAQKYPNIIKPIYQKQNVGIYRNTSDVLNACSGKYIASLDGDDCMLQGRLQKEFDFLELNKDVAIVFHNMKFIGENINKSLFNNSLDEKGCIIDLEDFVNIGLAHWSCSSKMYRKEYLPKEGLLKDLKCVEDQHFHLQIARYGKVAYSPEVLGLYRKHNAGLSQLNKDNIECSINDLVLTYNYACKFGIAKNIVNKKISFVYYDGACQYLMKKDYKMFIYYIEKSVSNNSYCNKKHQICFNLKKFPRFLYCLKIINELLHVIQGNKRI